VASRLQQVAAAVVALIEQGEAQSVFAHSITTERKYDTNLQLEDTDVISVQVIPAISNRTRLSYNTWNRDIALDVMVRKRFPASSFDSDGLIAKEEVDVYVELLEQIDDWLAVRANSPLPAYDQATYIEDDTKEADNSIVRELGIRFPYIPEHLRELHQYTGILRVAYHVEASDT
jgi:hypothetical protein